MIDFNNEEEIKDKLEDILFNRINDTELIIIKCHLLIEYALNHYIESISNQRLPIKQTRFTFSQKVKIARLQGLFDNDMNSELSRFIRDLNKLRNQIAHSLDYDSVLLDKIVNWPKFYKEEKWGTKENFVKNLIRIQTSWHCGRITGATKGHLKTVEDRKNSG